MSDLEVSLSPVSPAADDHPILDYVDAPTPDTMGVSPDRVASGKKVRRAAAGCQ